MGSTRVAVEVARQMDLSFVEVGVEAIFCREWDELSGCEVGVRDGRCEMEEVVGLWGFEKARRSLMDTSDTGVRFYRAEK